MPVCGAGHTAPGYMPPECKAPGISGPRRFAGLRRGAAALPLCLCRPPGEASGEGVSRSSISAAPRRLYVRTAHPSEGGAGCRARHPTAGAVPGDAAFAGESPPLCPLRVPLATSGPRAPGVCTPRNLPQNRELPRTTKARRRSASEDRRYRTPQGQAAVLHCLNSWHARARETAPPRSILSSRWRKTVHRSRSP